MECTSYLIGVANHTAWDNQLATDHPDWYERDWKGDFRSTPWWDWSDIIDLDYSQSGVRRYMTEAMKYWVRDVGVDGFRCDVAAYVPLDFWENLRAELDAIKPVFMLAEAQERDLTARAFDMLYAWDWKNAMHQIAKGEADTGALFGYYSANEKRVSAGRDADGPHLEPRLERLGRIRARALRRRPRGRDRFCRLSVKACR